LEPKQATTIFPSKLKKKNLRIMKKIPKLFVHK